jgi:prepilin-type N-terminal cleavage/methylation domain-containing protein
MNKNGFTLIEILLVVVLISIITAFSVPVFSSLVGSTELNDSVDKLVHASRRAQLLSETMKEDLSWGIFVDTDKIVVFGGDDYATRNSSFDEAYFFAEQINVSGDTEFVFEKLTGFPDSSVSLTLENNFGSQIVDINEVGLIEY